MWAQMSGFRVKSDPEAQVQETNHRLIATARSDSDLLQEVPVSDQHELMSLVIAR